LVNKLDFFWKILEFMKKCTDMGWIFWVIRQSH